MKRIAWRAFGLLLTGVPLIGTAIAVADDRSCAQLVAEATAEATRAATLETMAQP